MNHPLVDKKFLYPLLAFVGLTTFVFALTHDEIISSSAYKNNNDSVFTLYTNSSNTTEIEDYDIADELAKLKKPLDDDLINQEDYDRKKEKLLK